MSELMIGFVGKSFVDAIDGTGRRYRMLETVRAFGTERLVEAGEQQRLWQAHAAHFLRFAQAADSHLLHAEQLDWLRRLDAERDNLHAALRRAGQAGDAETGLRLQAALSLYWWLRGLRGESAGLAAELLDTVGPEPPPGLDEEYVLCVLNAMAGGAAGRHHRFLREWTRSTVYGLDRPIRHPFTIVLLSIAAGPPDEDLAAALLERQRRSDLHPWLRAVAPFGLGYQRLIEGDVIGAEREFGAALHDFRRLGERWGMANALSELAQLAGWRGDRARATALINEALDMARQLDSADDVAELLCRRGFEQVYAADLDGAVADYERAVDFARRAGALDKLAGAHQGLADVARLRGDLPMARRWGTTALAECPTGWFGAEETRAGIFISLARVAEAEGDVDAARSCHRRALATVFHNGGSFTLASAAEALAGMAILEADAERAARLLGVGQALRGSSVPDDPNVARVAEQARNLLGPAAYDSAFQRGAKKTRDQAVGELDAWLSAAGA